MRIFRKFFKVIGIAIAGIIVLLLISIGLVAVYQDDITNYTVKQLESTIDAPISVGKVSIAPFFSFPRLSAEIHKFYVGNPDNNPNDTLLFINSLKVGLDSWDLINGMYTIEEMKITGLDFEYVIDSMGSTNLDFMIDAFSDSTDANVSDTSLPTLDINAKKVKLTDIIVRYQDQRSGMGAQLNINNLSVKAKTNKNKIKGQAEGEIEISNCHMDSTRIDLMESCLISFKTEFDDRIALINEFRVQSQGLNISIEGDCTIRDTIYLNALIESRNLNLDLARRYFPQHTSDIPMGDSLPVVEFISLDIGLDYFESDISLRKLLINSEGFDMGVAGNFSMKDTMVVEASIEKLNLNIDVLKNYIPASYYKDYKINEIGGIVSLTANINGKIADSTLLPAVDGMLILNNVNVSSSGFPTVDKLNLTTKFESAALYDLYNTSIQITTSDITIGKSIIRLEGNIIGLDNSQYNLSSELDLDLSDFDSFIPDTLVQNGVGLVKAKIKTSGILPSKIDDKFIDYAIGNTNVSLSLEKFGGLLMDTILVEDFSTTLSFEPRVSGQKDFKVDALNIKSSSLNLNVSNSSLSASITGNLLKPEELHFNLRSLKLQTGTSKIVANGEVKNLNNPDFKIVSNINLNLNDIIAYIPDSLVDDIDGNVIAHIRSEGSINMDSIDVQLPEIIFNKSNLNLALNDVNLKFPDSKMNVGNIFARLDLRNDLLKIDKLSGTYNNLDFSIDSTSVKNIYKTILKNKKEELRVIANVNIGDFVFDDFSHLMNLMNEDLQEDDKNNTGTDQLEKDNINWTYLIYGSAGINSISIDSAVIEGFKINKLYIDDLSTLFMVTDSSFVMDQFKFNVFEGSMNNSMKYKTRKDGTQSISTHNIVENINIRTMLRDMDNFGMDSVISYENISGLFSTDIHTFIPISDSVLLDKVLVSGDLTLEKGGVYEYAPATEISRFTNVKELDNIQFKTLRSSIFMFKNKLYVPRTNIVSNAIDIAAFGMQDLNGDCQYHMEIHLSNILFGKSKRRNKKQENSGDEIDKESLKKRSQKIKYTITDGKSRVGPDTKDSRNNMMNKIRVQNKMLDFIFFPKNIHYNTTPENNFPEKIN